MEQTLLLTATITPPPDATALVRTDPLARLVDYLQALEFYLKQPDHAVRRILFVENSASDLTELRRLAARFPKEVEFVSFFGLDYPSSYGRGHGEFKLMDHAFDHSEMIRSLGPKDRIWKATGRLQLTNIVTMIQTAPRDYDLYCDFRDRPTRWMDLRFHSFTKKGYDKVFRGIASRIRDDLNNGEPCELIMREILAERASGARIIPRFRRQPFVEGISGAFNYNYAHGLKNKGKNYLRVLSRQLTPWLWI
jgi:hypothetical protein